VQLKLTPVGVGQVAERVLVAGARTREGLLGHARILASSSPIAGIGGNDVQRVLNSSANFVCGTRLNQRS
jgi:hypothetical protein